MKRLVLALAVAAVTIPAPLHAGAGSFTVVNGTSVNLQSLSIRRFGTSDWQPLPARPPAGASAAVPFADADCAFDLQGSLAGGETAVWTGVNLCEANVVTLRRSPAGETWVEYD